MNQLKEKLINLSEIDLDFGKHIKIISALLEIIEMQDKALTTIERISGYAGTPTKEINEYLIKQAGMKSPEIARQTLSETKQKLDELIKGE